MSSKLAIYKESLGHLEALTITSLSEPREPRRVLDDYYNGVLLYCLEAGLWNFAMRSVQADTSTSIEPTFGFDYAFQKPNDWVRTYLISTDEEMINPLLDYRDEAGLWFADFDPLFIRYISSDNAYGGDLSIWPESFANYVALRLARQSCKRITSSSSLIASLIVQERKALASAASKDAMNEPPGFPPMGTWARSRSGNYGNIRNLSRWGRS